MIVTQKTTTETAKIASDMVLIPAGKTTYEEFVY